MRWFSSFYRWASSAAATPVVLPRYAIEHPIFRGVSFTPEMLDSRIGR
ncbi:MAG: hypothetical protein RIM84_22115 [Alphaproteobacteria bacterium]